jgi:hypothetical protein
MGGQVKDTKRMLPSKSGIGKKKGYSGLYAMFLEDLKRLVESHGIQVRAFTRCCQAPAPAKINLRKIPKGDDGTASWPLAPLSCAVRFGHPHESQSIGSRGSVQRTSSGLEAKARQLI